MAKRTFMVVGKLLHPKFKLVCVKKYVENLSHVSLTGFFHRSNKGVHVIVMITRGLGGTARL